MATVSGTQASVSQAGSKTKNYQFAFALITALFFIFGFITCLNDILVPHLKSLFTLDYTRAALVQFCFFTAYFVVSLPAGKIVSRMGYKQGTVLGLLITAVGCMLFYPAAGMKSYTVFLVGLFVLASGITLIQVAVNPYVAVLGPSETASARLNLAQAFNSLGTTLAPMFGSALILSAEATTESAQASSVQGPYLGLALALVVLAVVVGFANLPKIVGASTEEAQDSAKAAAAADLPSAWAYSHLVLGAVGIFCYVGAEVAIGSYLINFMELPEIVGFTAATAGKYVALYWGGAMVGRFIGSAVLRKVRPGKVLAFNAAVAAALVLISMALSGPVAMVTILAVGLFNSIMFPTIFTLAISGLGKNTAQGSGILCMAIVGGALIPLVQGTLADKFGLHHSFVLPVICYAFIAYYGQKMAAKVLS
jgi:FHS family L-fucose permease-like MFS transporter